MVENYKIITLKANASEIKYVFKDIPHGKYAISLFHDKNENGECDRNFVGFPTEGYGFSDNFRPRIGPPKFKDTKFTLYGEMSITIYMIY